MRAFEMWRMSPSGLVCMARMGVEVDGGKGLMAVNKVAAAMLLSLFLVAR